MQSFSVALLLGLWRAAGAGDISRLVGTSSEIGLYESDTGLYFFDPLIAGDDAFYRNFYRWHQVHTLLRNRPGERIEFQRAASYIPAGAAILDVGCGPGTFAQHTKHARYRGLDPYAPEDADASVLRSTIEEHSERFPGTYDVVTAFQVIEHTAEPKVFAQRLLRLLKPGGLLILCAPLHPSCLTEIPNFVLNAPPHHLTWWNPPALHALATALDLTPVEIAVLPPSPHEAIVFWMQRFSMAQPDPAPVERYFAHRWAWHLNLAWCYGLGRIANHFLPLPRTARPIDVFMVARRPV